MTYQKQLADLFFDKEDGVYRGVVEYYEDDLSKPVSVPVEFAGEADVTFAEIEEYAFKRAKEILAEVLLV